MFETHREVIADASEKLTTILLDTHVPGLLPMLDELIGEDAVCILGCYARDPEEGEEVIDRLRSVTEPLIDMTDGMPCTRCSTTSARRCTRGGRKYTHRSVFVDEMTDDIHNIIFERKEAAPTPMVALGVWPLGANVGHGPDAAFAWDDKQYMITIEGNCEDYENQPTLDWAAETERQLRQAGAEGDYAGFIGVDKRDWENWTEQVYSNNYDRLAEMKAKYDPDNVFSHNINIKPIDS